MPPRKSEGRKSDVGGTIEAAATAAAAPEPTTTESPAQPTAPSKPSEKKDKDVTTIEDLTLPKSIITRLAKGVLPQNTQIQANAALAISKSAILFVNYLASHANEHTVAAGKKTIAPADVFKALEDIEFPFLKEPLEAEFAKFNAIQTEKRTSYRARVKATKDGGDGDTSMQQDSSTINAAGADETAANDDDDDAPRAKKAKVDGGDAEETEVEDDAEIDDEQDQQEHEEDDEDEDDDVEDDGDEDEEQGSGDETQDALEEPTARQHQDEALDGDESD